MREITVTLGEREYTVRQLPMRPEAAWRKRLQETLQPVLTLVENFDRIEFNSPADLAAFVRTLAPALMGAPDMMLELLYAYSPDLARDGEAIGATAYSDQVLEALLAVVGLAYPFGKLLAAGQRWGMNGAAARASATISTS